MTESVPVDCRSLHDLAVRFSPILRFHEQERFYPVLAESWLTHTTEAPWSEDTAHHLGDLDPDPNRRGMALCTLRDNTQLEVIAGQPIGRDRPLQLTDDERDPYAIGRAELRRASEEVFLALAGWPTAQRPGMEMSIGDLGRLYALFSEQAAAFNTRNEWLPLEGAFDRPHSWIPVSVNPTTYCEARATRDFRAISGSVGMNRDFPADDYAMEYFLALTYYYLYPAKEPDGEGNGSHLEGQWEAISVFIRGEGLGERGGAAFLPPEFVVASQGITPSAGNKHHNALRGWNQVEKLGEHPILYVARGNHRFFFEPVSGQTSVPPDPSQTPGADPGTHDDDRHEGGITDFLILGLILLALAAIALLVFFAALLAIAFILLALWLLFEWLKSLFDSGDNDASGTPVPGTQGNDEANEQGTQAGGNEPPGPPAPGAGGGSGGPSVGLPNTGSPTGRATVSFDVRLIDRVNRHDELTEFPAKDPCENPAWWDYSGGWGVRVLHGFSSGWEHGTRRVDEFGRSWAYWNALRVSTVLHGGQPQG